MSKFILGDITIIAANCCGFTVSADIGTSTAVDLVLAMACKCLQRVYCIQQPDPFILFAKFLQFYFQPQYFQDQILALQSTIWSGECGADNELELAAAAAQPVPQAQNTPCRCEDIKVKLRLENTTQGNN